MGVPLGKHIEPGYNPITHQGDAPAVTKSAAAARTGAKFASATAAKCNLQGSSCTPKSDAAGTELKNSSRPNALLHLPARVDHLAGTACIPGHSRCDGSSSEASTHSKHAATKAKMLTLRAAVDHLSGEGCTVRQVDVVATLDAPPPTVSRVMATRLVRDRQIARAAHEHNMSSCLYEPGQGYTKVLLTGQDKAAPWSHE